MACTLLISKLNRNCLQVSKSENEDVAREFCELDFYDWEIRQSHHDFGIEPNANAIDFLRSASFTLFIHAKKQALNSAIALKRPIEDVAPR